MNEYINLTLENIEKEHICCAIGDPKHQVGVNNKKEWIKICTLDSKKKKPNLGERNFLNIMVLI